MSKYLIQKNSESVLQLFNKKTFYRGIAISNNPALTNFEAEKILYGRVNRNFVPIYAPGSRNEQFKYIGRTNNSQQGMQVLNFVADAFNDLIQHFAKCSKYGKIDTNERFLSTIKAFKGYEDPKAAYERYHLSYKQIMKNDIFKQKNKIMNFNDVSNYLLDSLSVSKVTSPFSFSGYVKNRRNNIMSSGLAIEIANIDKSNDDMKYLFFLNSKNWNFYLNVAETFGFMVDVDVPWRLVADIGSKQMLEYASAYGLNSTDQILKRYYTPAGTEEITFYPEKMLGLYDFVKPPFIEEFVAPGEIIEAPTNSQEGYDTPEVYYRPPSTAVKRVLPQQYKNVSTFKEEVSKEQMVNLYCNIRFLEEELQLTENEKMLIIDDVVELMYSNNIFYAIRKFELFINQPFDYIGSIGYNIRQQRLQTEQDRTTEQETISVTVGY
jgi:hypothetical protein